MQNRSHIDWYAQKLGCCNNL